MYQIGFNNNLPQQRQPFYNNEVNPQMRQPYSYNYGPIPNRGQPFPYNNSNPAQMRQPFPNYPNQMKPSFSVPNFGAPPNNLDFDLNEQEPNKVTNMKIGNNPTMTLEEIIKDGENKGLQIRVKKVLHVQKAEDPSAIPLPPTPPPCTCEVCLKKKAEKNRNQPSNSRQNQYYDNDQNKFNNNKNSRQKQYPEIAQKPNGHELNFTCHSCEPRKFCLCNECKNQGNQKLRTKLNDDFPIRETPKEFNRNFINNAPPSISDISGPFIKPYEDRTIKKKVKIKKKLKTI